MKKKYAVWPSEVVSKRDGDIHYIGFIKLCRLYGVNPSECVDMTKEENREVYPHSLIHLHVKKDGQYDSNNRHVSSA